MLRERIVCAPRHAAHPVKIKSRFLSTLLRVGLVPGYGRFPVFPWLPPAKRENSAHSQKFKLRWIPYDGARGVD